MTIWRVLILASIATWGLFSAGLMLLLVWAAISDRRNRQHRRSEAKPGDVYDWSRDNAEHFALWSAEMERRS